MIQKMYGYGLVALIGVWGGLVAQQAKVFQNTYTTTTASKTTNYTVGTLIKPDTKKHVLTISAQHHVKDERYIQQLDWMLNNQYWFIDFPLELKTSTPNTKCLVLAATSSILNPIQKTTDATTFNDNHVVAVVCTYNQLLREATLKPLIKKNAQPYQLTEQGISVPSLDSTYYIRLERSKSTEGLLSVFYDKEHQQHVPGSPICFPISPQIVDLKYLQTSSFNQNNTDLPKAFIKGLFLKDSVINREGQFLNLASEYAYGSLLNLQAQTKESWTLYKLDEKGMPSKTPLQELKNQKTFQLNTKDLTPNRSYVLRKSISGEQQSCGSGTRSEGRFFVKGLPYSYEQSQLFKSLKQLPLDRSLVLEDIQFLRSESYLLEEAYDQLDTLTSILKAFPKMTILLEGHTEAIGDAEANQELSKERVDEVKQQLIRLGIEPKRIKTIGLGMKQPKYAVSSKNRRVEIRVLNWD